MDIVFCALCIILAFIIISIYIVNRIPYTSDVQQLAKGILKIDPTIRNFTLGQVEATKKFQNVVLANDGKIQVVSNDYPIRKNGTLYILKSHGQVFEHENGFRIEGLDTIHFKCPDGYSGYTCQLDNICTDDDIAGTLKPLTQTQFNALQLYRNDPQTALVVDTITRTVEDLHHPRLRIKCLDNMGNFQLQACPDNSLLDEHLQCRIYDICQDSLNGYKHTYHIDSGETLLPNEYYICRNNRSEKMQCTNGTVFSDILKSCISQSVCVGKGASATLPLTETSYIQCRNDVGIRIECPDGVVNNVETGTLSCKHILCRPKTLKYSDNLLKYNYGEVTCTPEGVAHTTLCDTDKNPKIYTLDWAERSTYTLDNWPMEILRDGKCIPASHDDLTLFDDEKPSVVSLRYTNAMPDEHPYNLKTRQFECPPETAKRWDYDAQQQQRDNDTSQSIWYSGAPCQMEPITPYPFKFNIQKYPSDKIYIFVTESVNIEPLRNEPNIYYWPVRTAENEYQHTIFTHNDTHLSVDTYKSNALPLGFTLPKSSDSNKLELIGYPNAPNTMTAQYYFISSGKLETVQLHNRQLVRHQEFEYANDDNTRTIETTRLSTIGVGVRNFAIKMSTFRNKIRMRDVSMLNPKYLTIDPIAKTIQYGNYKYNLGYSVFGLSSLGMVATLTYADIAFAFSTVLYPNIKF